MSGSAHARFRKTAGFRPLLSAAATLLLLTAAPPLAAQTELVRMKGFTPHETKVDVFSIKTPQVVQIEAVGADEFFPAHGAWSFIDKLFGGIVRNDRDGGAWRGNAWIVNAATRSVVWELRSSDADKASGGIRGFKGSVQLEPGLYEAYYASYSSFRSTLFNKTSRAMTEDELRRNIRYDDDGVSRKFSFTIRGNGQALPSATYLQNVDAFRRDAIVSLTGLKRSETRNVGFSLSKPTRIEVYALGEVSGGEPADYGWIINADTYEKVWELNDENSHPAGGASKNRVARQALTLPPGRYAAMYTLDDSHDIADWNAPPPLDPGLWGLTIKLADASDRTNVRMFRYDGKPANTIVALTGIGDRERRTAGFTLTKPTAVRVFAMGEGSGRSMSDYGWITDAKTHATVWTMKREATAHAGGSSKNRVANQVINLPAGSYVVHYRSDDSHAFGDFNSSPPVNAELWGITVAGVNAADLRLVKAYDADTEGGRVLARLVGMEDNEDARATFRLDRPTDVRVYAIGEGSGDDMHDYGFIEERGSGRVVWEMTYRMTSEAGGAEKNRKFDGVVRLPAGEYVIRWLSDGSHSFEDWNTTEPDDSGHWGITVYRPDTMTASN
ncbi:MAG TPA: hypothetical protein VF035_05775 [Longimicrobiales bacterium]